MTVHHRRLTTRKAIAVTIYLHGCDAWTSLCRQLPDLPALVNERLMKLRFPFNTSRHVTVISAYVPTLTSSDEARDAYHEETQRSHEGCPPPLPLPPSDKLILLGDINARVGTDCKNWKGVLRPHGTVKLDSNGLMLLSFCAENDLTITNTLFRQADKYRTKWMHKDRNSGIGLTMSSVAAETSVTSESPQQCGVGRGEGERGRVLE